MQIRDIILPNNVFLAPMAGVTDIPFRVLCREQGCGLVYTEMVSAKAMHYNDTKSGKIADVVDEEMPAGIQIFGSDPKILADIAYKLNDSKACLIDINMGCPAPKITKNGEGSALMNTPQLVGQIVKEVTSASTKPVTVKIRKGWDDNSVNAVEIAKIIEANGASAIAIHGRTREQYYSGKADWGIIKQVKESVSIPVIGNGDIVSPKDAEEILTRTGCDGIMIGRGAQGNPWIFNKVLKWINSREIVEDITLEEKLSTIIRHMNLLIELKGERTGICEMRSHIAWYIKGIRNATYAKERIFKLWDKDEIIDTLKEYLHS